MTARAACVWALLMAGSLPLALPAQDDVPAVYAVEIIVFRNLDQSRNTPEVGPRRTEDSFAARDRDSADSTRPSGTSVPAETVEPLTRTDRRERPQPGFLLLEPRNLRPPVEMPGDQLMLGDLLQRLRRLDAYEPLAHIGWEQGASGRETAQAYWLNPALESRTGLTGNITLYRERFLHLALDLQLTESGPGVPGDPSAAAPRIRESRLLRDDTLQYFDHPGFGVIARVSRREDPPAASAAASP